jgi:hypothetical protein
MGAAVMLGAMPGGRRIDVHAADRILRARRACGVMTTAGAVRRQMMVQALFHVAHVLDTYTP